MAASTTFRKYVSLEYRHEKEFCFPLVFYIDEDNIWIKKNVDPHNVPLCNFDEPIFLFKKNIKYTLNMKKCILFDIRFATFYTDLKNMEKYEYICK